MRWPHPAAEARHFFATICRGEGKGATARTRRSTLRIKAPPLKASHESFSHLFSLALRVLFALFPFAFRLSLPFAKLPQRDNLYKNLCAWVRNSPFSATLTLHSLTVVSPAFSIFAFSHIFFCFSDLVEAAQEEKRWAARRSAERGLGTYVKIKSLGRMKIKLLVT